MKEDNSKFRINGLFSAISLGIVCPMANERSFVEQFVKDVMEECRGFEFKSVNFFAILDNASKDGTLEIVRDLSKQICELQFIFAPENQCVVDAYIRGYYEAMRAMCDWILEIDAGYSHQPTDIPKFFKTMMEGSYDCVFGSRFCPGGKFTNSPKMRYVISRGGTFLANLLLGTKLHDMTSGFELFTNNALQEILSRGIISRGPFFQTEIRTYAHGFRITEVPIHYRAASHRIDIKVLRDAFSGLRHLFRLRLANAL